MLGEMNIMKTVTNIVIAFIGKVARIFWGKTNASAEYHHCVLDSLSLEFLVFVAMGFSVFTANPVLARGTDYGRFEKINIANEDPRNGFFDISVEYGDNGTGWMAYSRVELPKHVETHIARSTDRGRTWSYAGQVNQSVDGSVIIDGRTHQGVWRYETPTLLFDTEDIPARRWKLFVHRYLTVPPYRKEDRLFENGWIEYKYASTPGGAWSKGIRLFCKRENNCRIDLNSLHKDLKSNRMYSEIGSITVDGTIYLSMDVSTSPTGLGQWKHHKIVLVSSQDHGMNWSYVGTLTDYNDADALGYLVLTGSSLVKDDERLFMLVTPSGAKGLFKKKRGHDGTLVLAFDDISRARLKRDAKGKLVVLKTIKPDSRSHSGGLSDYDERNVYGGVLFSQINLYMKPEIFQIFSTKQRIDQQGASAGADKPRR